MRSAGVLGAVKLANAIRRIDPGLDVTLKNIRVNRVSASFSGFVTDGRGHYIYVNTDCGHRGEVLIRTAKGPKNYTGGLNHFASHTAAAEVAVDLLRNQV